MNENDLFSAIGEIDEELIAQSEETKIKKFPVKAVVSIAACLFICVTAVAFGSLFSGKMGKSADKAAESYEEKNVIEDYAGAEDVGDSEADRDDLPFVEFAMTCLSEDAASLIDKEESYVAATYTGEDGKEYSVVHLSAGEKYYEVTILSDMSEIIGLSSYN